MGAIRQNRIEQVIQQEVATAFQQHAGDLCLGAMVTPTIVRVTPDLSLAQIYLSIFAGPSKEEVMAHIKANRGKVRGIVGKRIKNMKQIPQLDFHIDDSLDYAEKIDELLKK